VKRSGRREGRNGGKGGSLVGAGGKKGGKRRKTKDKIGVEGDMEPQCDVENGHSDHRWGEYTAGDK